MRQKPHFFDRDILFVEDVPTDLEPPQAGGIECLESAARLGLIRDPAGVGLHIVRTAQTQPLRLFANLQQPLEHQKRLAAGQMDFSRLARQSA